MQSWEHACKTLKIWIGLIVGKIFILLSGQRFINIVKIRDRNWYRPYAKSVEVEIPQIREWQVPQSVLVSIGLHRLKESVPHPLPRGGILFQTLTDPRKDRPNVLWMCSSCQLSSDL